MADAIRVGIIGGGWPGKAHARGYLASGGFRLGAVADLIPQLQHRLPLKDTIAQIAWLATGLVVVTVVVNVLH